MVKWWRKSIIQWIVWLYLTVPWVFRFGLVSLLFIHNANDSHPDDYGESRLCYLWCLMFYPLFCLVIFPFFPMLKWCNVDIIPYSADIIVRRFHCRYCFIVNLNIGVNFFSSNVSRGVFPGTVSRNSFFLRTILETRIVPGYVPG